VTRLEPVPPGTPPVPPPAAAEVARRQRREHRFFAVGVSAVVAGAALHWPDFLGMAGQHYRLAGMAMSPQMWLGMALIVAGLAVAVVGFLPSGPLPRSGGSYRVEAMDERRLSWVDVRVLAVLVFALVIDIMKPATIGFVIPGGRAEYGLTTLQVSLWPLVALTGTTVGSLVWGLMADRVGRRPATLLATLMFAGTSICGAMPAYQLNLAMCFLMGASAGGMLPLAYALLAELMPRRHRSWLAVLVGSIGSAGGYLAASLAAALLMPAFSWRVLWLIGLPTGLVLCLLARYIPESPRFLLLAGRDEEARMVMRDHGVHVLSGPAVALDERHPAGRRAVALLVRPPHVLATLALVLYGVGWGMVNFGFLTWLPTLLMSGGGSAAFASGLIARSALVALPGAVLMALLYGFWRTRDSLSLFAIGIGVSLLALALLIGRGLPAWAMAGLLVVLLTMINGSSAALSSYSADVYPTAVRGTGSGLVAAAMKLGGVLGPQLLAVALAAGVGLVTPALVVAGPLLVAALLVWQAGLETRGHRLEDVRTASG
jgi:MFS transporter, putative metabolite:H+ symporter